MSDENNTTKTTEADKQTTAATSAAADKQGEGAAPVRKRAVHTGWEVKLVHGQTYTLRNQTFTRGAWIGVSEDVKKHLEENATESNTHQGRVTEVQKFEFRKV